MLKFISLGSGSSGNCYYLNCDGYGVVIDLGIGLRQFKRTFSNYGLTLAQIKAILVTHDHADHAKTVATLSCDFRLPVYTSQKVHDSMLSNRFLRKKVEPEMRHATECGIPFELGPFEITTFHVPHDSADNNGFIMRADGKCFVLLTDVGHFTDEMAGIIADATHLVIEANYDEQMLETGKYPQRLKKRIKNGYGHSSNTATANFIAQHVEKEKIRRIWLCHLSAENNLPRIAYETTAAILKSSGLNIGDGADTKLEILARTTPSLLTEL